MQKIIYILLLLCIFSFAANAQNVDNQQIKFELMMKMLNLKEALIGKDSSALSNLLADDVSYGHTNGLMQTKQQLILDIASGVQDYKSIEPSEMNIRIYNNTGVVTMKSHVNLAFNNNLLDLNMFVTLVWIKNNNNWILEARQSVKINE